MNTYTFFGIFLLFLFPYLNSQVVDEQQQQQQSTTLTRDNVEALLRVLSDTCRSEMESALNKQSDISAECKEEIQGALISLNIPIGQQQPPQEQQNNRGDADSGKQRRAANRVEEDMNITQKSPGVSPIYYVLGFVIVFFAIIAGLVIYVSKQRADYMTKKPKKLSKKKVLVDNVTSLMSPLNK